MKGLGPGRKVGVSFFSHSFSFSDIILLFIYFFLIQASLMRIPINLWDLFSEGDIKDSSLKCLVKKTENNKNFRIISFWRQNKSCIGIFFQLK